MAEVFRFPGTSDDEGSPFATPNQTGTPERRLLMAILERAILDFVGNDKKEVETAREWLFDAQNEEKSGSFSFEWVCQELDLDVLYVRSVIARMPRRGKRKIAPWYFDKDYLKLKDAKQDYEDCLVA